MASASDNATSQSDSNTASNIYNMEDEIISIQKNRRKSDSPSLENPPKRRRTRSKPLGQIQIIELSPEALLASNPFVCEVCNKGFSRDQNLQLHRRGHNLPWKLKTKAKNEPYIKKLYICPNPDCTHHHPDRALGDLTGIKKHYGRKHGEKKYPCEKCGKMYAVQSDMKAHLKICGTKKYTCCCGTIFSRKDSYDSHRIFCENLVNQMRPMVQEPRPNNVENHHHHFTHQNNNPRPPHQLNLNNHPNMYNHQRFTQPHLDNTPRLSLPQLNLQDNNSTRLLSHPQLNLNNSPTNMFNLNEPYLPLPRATTNNTNNNFNNNNSLLNHHYNMLLLNNLNNINNSFFNNMFNINMNMNNNLNHHTFNFSFSQAQAHVPPQLAPWRHQHHQQQQSPPPLPPWRHHHHHQQQPIFHTSSRRPHSPSLTMSQTPIENFHYNQAHQNVAPESFTFSHDFNFERATTLDFLGMSWGGNGNGNGFGSTSSGGGGGHGGASTSGTIGGSEEEGEESWEDEDLENDLVDLRFH